jgi:co-chaperonin GroES (HSP10)
MLKAIAWRVLVKPDPIEEKTSGGIVLALDEKLEKGARMTGVIVDIGDDVFPNSLTEFAGLKVGDRIYFAKYAGKVVVDKNTKEEYIVLNDEDCVVKEE